MEHIFTLFIIGLALSMDAFSLSLALGSFGINKKNRIILALMVGFTHFYLPLVGHFFGEKLINWLGINTSLFIASIFLLIAFEMIHSIIVPNEKSFNLSLVGKILFSFSVSFDSFSIGIGLGLIATDVVIAPFIFAILSFLFTYLGLSLGKFAKKRLGTIANVFGALLLIVTAITFLCKQ